MSTITPQQALHRLAALCSRGECCIYDLRRKMIRWELSETVQQQIIRQLQKEQFLNEQRFCMAYVKDKSKYNRWGINKIRYELKKKQIADALINEALSAIDPQDNREQLRQLLESKRKSVKGNSAYEINQKLVRFAVGRGFSYDDIAAILQL
ncbi:MAG: RecX family transcriptional regulator [Candidatus Symbiothrix sp.]|jgi:regulatory protein|nr:RecX family transcriptional regulator [Candidatus Symbiothrix sp.]